MLQTIGALADIKINSRRNATARYARHTDAEVREEAPAELVKLGQESALHQGCQEQIGSQALKGISTRHRGRSKRESMRCIET
ncbi:MAG: hypothetical protein EXS30_06940 [Pedosphaera sp.]|nr:hypothetical protein [Pedosphaera sp.]